MFVFVSISIREIKRLLLLLKEAIPKGFSSTKAKCKRVESTIMKRNTINKQLYDQIG